MMNYPFEKRNKGMKSSQTTRRINSVKILGAHQKLRLKNIFLDSVAVSQKLKNPVKE